MDAGAATDPREIIEGQLDELLKSFDALIQQNDDLRTALASRGETSSPDVERLRAIEAVTRELLAVYDDGDGVVDGYRQALRDLLASATPVPLPIPEWGYPRAMAPADVEDVERRARMGHAIDAHTALSLMGTAIRCRGLAQAADGRANAAAEREAKVVTENERLRAALKKIDALATIDHPGADTVDTLQGIARAALRVPA